jgi:hypothetical protein
MDRMNEPYQRWRRDYKLETCRVFLHKNLSRWVAPDEPGNYCSKSNFQKHLDWRVFKLLGFQERGVKIHFIVAFSGELVSGSMDRVNLENSDFKGHILNRFLVVDDMHWSCATNGFWPFTWTYGVSLGFCKQTCKLVDAWVGFVEISEYQQKLSVTWE